MDDMVFREARSDSIADEGLARRSFARPLRQVGTLICLRRIVNPPEREAGFFRPQSG